MNLEERADEFIRGFFAMAHRYTLEPQKRGLLVGVSKPEIFLIHALGEEGRLNMTELANRMSVALSTVTGIVDRLIARGCVIRERTEEDRRLVFVELTEKGREMFRQDREAQRRVAKEVLSNLSEAEQEELVALVRKLAGRLNS